MRILLVILLFSFVHAVSAQNDSVPYNLYKEQLVLKSSLGYNTAPFSIRGDFNSTKETLKYRANMNAVLGLGFSYKWLSLGLNFALPGYLKTTTKFGETNYFDIDLNFDIKLWYFAFDIHSYQGFALIDAVRFSDTLVSPGSSNQLKPSLRSASVGLNGYRFKNKSFNRKAALGIVGNYKEDVTSFFVKYTMNLHGVANSTGLMPSDHLNDIRSIVSSNAFSAFDFGAVPGYVYINNLKGWQYGGMAGLGLVLQSKFYQFNNTTRGFLGLAPRYDLRLMGGYNVSNWFCMIDLQFDNKTIRFNDIRYGQNYYYLRILYGYRFKKNKIKQPS
jgi:hypothetical protein